MGYRRGFKAEANWYARSMRDELGILPHAPLCPWKLAQYLRYTVVKLSDYALIHPDEVRYFQTGKGQKEFSAITLYSEEVRWIMYNDTHSLERQAANISHELAHGLLMHAPAPLRGEDGTRTFNEQQEAEANWLGPALLISEEAALFIAEEDLPLSVARELYRVSLQVLEMRLRVTGARIRVARRRVAA